MGMASGTKACDCGVARKVICNWCPRRTLAETLGSYRPNNYKQAALPGLQYVAMAFTKNGLQAIGIADDLGLIVNFTVGREYRISSFSEHMAVRAVLARALRSYPDCQPQTLSSSRAQAF